MFIIIHHNIYQSLYLWYIRTIYHCGSIFMIFDIHVCELGSISRSCECVYNGYCLPWKSYLKKYAEFGWKQYTCIFLHTDQMCGCVCLSVRVRHESYIRIMHFKIVLVQCFILTLFFFCIFIFSSIFLFSYSSFIHFFNNILVKIRCCFKYNFDTNINW